MLNILGKWIKDVKSLQDRPPVIIGLKWIWVYSEHNIIAEEILKYLSLQDAYNLRLGSKSFQTFFERSRIWWILIIQHLSKQPWSGYSDNPMPEYLGTLKLTYPYLHELIAFIERRASNETLKLMAYAFYEFTKCNDMSLAPYKFFCQEKFHPIIKALHEKGYNLNHFVAGLPHSDSFASSFLHRTLAMGNLKSAHFFLTSLDTCERNKGFFDDIFCTPLHYACYYPQPHVVQYLLSNEIGINIDAKNKLGKTALHSACVGYSNKSHHWRLIESYSVIQSIILYAKKKGININMVDNRGRTPFYMACMGLFEDQHMDSEQIKIHRMVLELFFAHKDMVDFHSPGDWIHEFVTPFCVTIIKNMPWAVEIFLQNAESINLDLNAIDMNGLTPLELAAKLEDKTIEKMISEKLNATQNIQNT